ncbi:DNA internalization-related competence protein ComEC/Rec2 [bacterium]|nr:DNA internalization-related competence protein ComEC/Rec2 [bacterium]
MNKPAFKTFILFALGILLAHSVKLPFFPVLLTVTGLAILSIILINRKKPAGKLLNIIIFFSIILSGSAAFIIKSTCIPASDIAFKNNPNTRVTLKAWLKRDPVYKSGRKELYAEAEAVTAGDTTYTCTGTVLISYYRHITSRIKYGDEFLVDIRLVLPDSGRNPGGFDYRAFLAAKKIYTLGKSGNNLHLTGINRGSWLNLKIIYPSRRFVKRSLKKHIEKPALPLVLALLTGDRGMLSEDVTKHFANAGALHILAVSGLHVGFVLLFLEILLGLMRIPVRIRIPAEIAGLLFFTMITETRASIVRAFVMATLFLTGRLFKRRADAVNIIGISGIILLAVNPGWLFDVGFLLSFSAVFSIVYFYPRFKKFLVYKHIFPKKKYLANLADVIIVSICAQIGTLPISLTSFNNLPLLAPLVNIIAIPVAGIIVSLGLLTILFSLISSFIADIYGICTSFVIYFLNWFTSAVSGLKFSAAAVPSPGTGLIIIYINIILSIFSTDKRIRKILIFTSLIISSIFIWDKALFGSFSDITYIQFDVGQGDSALIIFPGGKTMLIDGGNKTPFFDSGKRIIAPFLLKNGFRKIDAVISTNPDKHYRGGLIYILKHFSIGRIFYTGADYNSPLNHEFNMILKNKNIPGTIITAPDSIVSFPGTKIYFLSPYSLLKKGTAQNINNTSLITEICFGFKRFLFMSDAESPAEKVLIDKSLIFKSDILKVGRHGSKNSCSANFLKRISPEIAVISAGRKNKYRHPSTQCISRLKSNAISIIRTDLNGAVIIKTDGKRISVQ